MLCYGILCGNESFVSTDVQYVNTFIQHNAGCICRVFDTIREATSFIQQSLGTRPTVPSPTKMRVPIKSRTVAYLYFSFSKDLNECNILLRRRGVDPLYLSPVQGKSVTSMRLKIEIEALSRLADEVQDITFTVYTSCVDLLNMYNKFLPKWEEQNWVVENPPAELEDLRALRKKLGTRTLHLKEIQRGDAFAKSR